LREKKKINGVVARNIRTNGYQRTKTGGQAGNYKCGSKNEKGRGLGMLFSEKDKIGWEEWPENLKRNSSLGGIITSVVGAYLEGVNPPCQNQKCAYIPLGSKQNLGWRKPMRSKQKRKKRTRKGTNRELSIKIQWKAVQSVGGRLGKAVSSIVPSAQRSPNQKKKERLCSRDGGKESPN